MPNQVGLRYRVVSSQSLSEGSWLPIGGYEISDGLSGIAEFDISDISAAFFRVELAPPLNSDSDALNDWEEGQLGTNPLLSDTDNDRPA
ncbi:MAG: hypothetical protein GVY36_16845 [Verrucomicrobia bacterium]|nr:hypothetical protein [Verrucomicrobiota bacterium]